MTELDPVQRAEQIPHEAFIECSRGWRRYKSAVPSRTMQADLLASPTPFSPIAAWVTQAARTSFAQVVRHRRRTLRRGRPEDLHRLRTSLRRLAATLRLSEWSLEFPEASRASAVAALIAATGALRDHDVEREILEPLVGATGLEGDRLVRWLRDLGRRRSRLLARTRRALRSRATRDALLSIRRALRQPGWLPFGFRDGEDARMVLLEHYQRQVRAEPAWRLGRRAARTAGRMLHELRLRAKEVRHIEAALGREPGALVAAVAVLGRLRDLDRLISRLPTDLPVTRDQLERLREDALDDWEEARQPWLTR
jgi:CHAD domain-containing protein